MSVSASKQLGQVWTPTWMVERMLDHAGFFGGGVLDWCVLEPSFGEGVFLYSLIDRWVDAAREAGLSTGEMSLLIDSNLYGVEYDEGVYEATVDALKGWAETKHGLSLGLPHLYCGDTLSHSFPEKFDLIVGNPPYVRVHNLVAPVRERLKSLNLAGAGTSDLYVAFFEVALGWLKPDTGRLCYVAPNGWLKNPSQRKFREYVHGGGWLCLVEDYGQVGVFPASTYTAVALLMKGDHFYTL